MTFQISTPSALAQYAMSAVDCSVKHVEGSHYDITATRGRGIRLIENGPIHPLVKGRPTPARLTLYEAKQLLGLNDPA